MTSTIVQLNSDGRVHGADAAPAETAVSDETLLKRYCDSADREAFEALVHRYEGELYSYLRRYLGDAAMAEDAFQTTFLQVHLKRHLFEPGRKVRPWLYTIATNQAIDAQRRNKRHRMVSLDRRNRKVDNDDVGSLLEMSASGEPGPFASLELRERRRSVQEAVASLPETLRTAVSLIYYQGLKYREAAEVLSIPVGTVKSRLHSAVGKLGDVFKKSGMLDDA